MKGSQCSVVKEVPFTQWGLGGLSDLSAPTSETTGGDRHKIKYNPAGSSGYQSLG